jgi:hypothetical protein
MQSSNSGSDCSSSGDEGASIFLLHSVLGSLLASGEARFDEHASKGNYANDESTGGLVAPYWSRRDSFRRDLGERMPEAADSKEFFGKSLQWTMPEAAKSKEFFGKRLHHPISHMREFCDNPALAGRMTRLMLENLDAKEMRKILSSTSALHAIKVALTALETGEVANSDLQRVPQLKGHNTDVHQELSLCNQESSLGTFAHIARTLVKCRNVFGSLYDDKPALQLSFLKMFRQPFFDHYLQKPARFFLLAYDSLLRFQELAHPSLLVLVALHFNARRYRNKPPPTLPFSLIHLKFHPLQLQRFLQGFVIAAAGKLVAPARADPASVRYWSHCIFERVMRGFLARVTVRLQAVL